MESEDRIPEEKQPPKKVDTLVIVLILALVGALIVIAALAFSLAFQDGDEVAATQPPPVVTIATPEVPELVPTRAPPITLPEPEPDEPTGRVIAPDGVNVRTGPGFVYPVLGVASYGTEGEISGVSPDGQWWAAPVPGAPNDTGWVAAEYVAAENVENVSVLPPPPTPTPAATATPTATPAPNIVFTASRYTITAGETTVLAWSVENVKAVYMYPIGADPNRYPVTGQGSREVQPFITTSYELLVIDRNDNSQIARLEVAVLNGLTSGTWVLQTYMDANGVLVAAQPGAQPTVRFASTGALEGWTGCNSMSGSFFSYEDVLRIGTLSLSQAACDQALMAQEAAFRSNLAGAAGFSITGNQMTTRDNVGRTTLSFSR